MSAIENVIFDVGRVLFHWDLRHLFAKLIDDPAELDWFLNHVVTEEWHFQHDAGRPLAEMLQERSAQFPGHAHLIEAYTKRFTETIPGPVEGSLEILEQLSASSVPLFAITNFGAEFWDLFRPTQPVFDLFTDIIVSGREKLVKPDPAIYALACDRFSIDPASAIFIDDNLANIDAACDFGLHVHHFRDAANLREDLARLGLL
ncbi:HAD family hydrolase [Sphingorhabdus arenilitoris]|uniref:HAD family hydrolase n=1 Tax=Sphingorhabdus arenilitoris TaxID=1490041 RepID=A0ABV8REF0_9SPHN